MIDAFSQSDPEVYVWCKLEYLYEPVKVKFEWYRPDGESAGTSISDWTEDPQLSGYSYWYWWKFWSWLPLSGTSNLLYPGTWSVRIYVDSGSGWNYETTETFVLRYDLVDHAMAKGVDVGGSWDPLGETNTFYQTDLKAYSWAKAEKVSESLDVRWEFIEPNGSLYTTIDHQTDSPQASGYDYWGWSKMYGSTGISGFAAADKCGDWDVNFLVKDPFGSWQIQYTDHFELLEQPSISPYVTLTVTPSSPQPGEPILVLVSATDNTYLDDVVLRWEALGWQSQVLGTDILAGSFSATFGIGAFAAGQTITLQADGTDTSGNQGTSPLKTITIPPLVQDCTSQVVPGSVCAAPVADGTPLALGFSLDPAEQAGDPSDWSFSPTGGWPADLDATTVSETASDVILSVTAAPGTPPGKYEGTLTWVGTCNGNPGTVLTADVRLVVTGLSPSDPALSISPLGPGASLEFSAGPAEEVVAGSSSWEIIPDATWPAPLVATVTADGDLSAAVVSVIAQYVVPAGAHTAELRWSGTLACGGVATATVPVSVDVEPLPPNVHVVQGGGTAAIQAAIDQASDDDLILLEPDAGGSSLYAGDPLHITRPVTLVGRPWATVSDTVEVPLSSWMDPAAIIIDEQVNGKVVLRSLTVQSALTTITSSQTRPSSAILSKSVNVDLYVDNCHLYGEAGHAAELICTDSPGNYSGSDALAGLGRRLFVRDSIIEGGVGSDCAGDPGYGCYPFPNDEAGSGGAAVSLTTSMSSLFVRSHLQGGAGGKTWPVTYCPPGWDQCYMPQLGDGGHASTDGGEAWDCTSVGGTGGSSVDCDGNPIKGADGLPLPANHGSVPLSVAIAQPGGTAEASMQAPAGIWGLYASPAFSPVYSLMLPGDGPSTAVLSLPPFLVAGGYGSPATTINVPPEAMLFGLVLPTQGFAEVAPGHFRLTNPDIGLVVPE